MPIDSHAQFQPSVNLEPATVLTDSKGNPKAIHLEFKITTQDVVDRAKLSLRKFGTLKYEESKLRLSPDLLYEAFVPYTGKIEYFLTITPERGTAFTFGSSANPHTLSAEDLSRVKDDRHPKYTKVSVIVGIIVAGLGIFGIGAVLRGKKNKRSPK